MTRLRVSTRKQFISSITLGIEAPPFIIRSSIPSMGSISHEQGTRLPYQLGAIWVIPFSWNGHFVFSISLCANEMLFLHLLLFYAFYATYLLSVRSLYETNIDRRLSLCGRNSNTNHSPIFNWEEKNSTVHLTVMMCRSWGEVSSAIRALEFSAI